MKKKKYEEFKNKFMIISMILVYGITICIVFLNKISDKEEEKINSYIMISGEEFFTYEDYEIKPISINDTDFSNSLFKVYNDKNYSGEFYPSRVEYQYVSFTKKGGSGMFKPEIPFIAVTKDISVIDFETEELDYNDIFELEKYLETKNIYEVGELISSYKVNIDLDNDNNEETIYFASNYNYMSADNNTFSISYIIDNDQINVIEENYFLEEENNIYDDETYIEEHSELINSNLRYIIDLDGKKEYVLVISSSDSDTTTTNFYKKEGSYYKNIRIN